MPLSQPPGTNLCWEANVLTWNQSATVAGGSAVLGSRFANNIDLVDIDPLGEKFDPHKHQAISLVEAEAEPNTVVQVLQKGYTLHDRVLRPALVIVAKPRA